MLSDGYNVPTVELHISKSNDEYFFLLNDPSRRTSLLREKLTIPNSARGRINRKLDALLSDIGLLRSVQETAQREEGEIVSQKTAEFGSLIFKYMIPLTFRNYLEQLTSKNVVISTNDIEIPWELLFDGEKFLCLECGVGRKVQSKIQFEETQRRENAKPRALFIVDPTEELPDAEREVTHIIQHIKNMGLMEINCLKQKDATAENLLELVEEQPFDILHYAGHAEFDAKSPEESCLVLHDETITASYILQVMANPPKLAFINACSSATTTHIEYLETHGKLTGMATAFLTSGVDAYIGTLWPVHDEVASELAIAFYEKIFKGKTVGLALRDAKKNVFSKHGNLTNTWASFVLYGEPCLLIIAPQERKTQLQELTKIKLEEKTGELEEFFNRKIEFYNQVGEVFDNVKRAFKLTKNTLSNKINLQVEAKGLPVFVEKDKKIIKKRINVEEFTLCIYGDKRAAAHFIKHLAQLHILWYKGFDEVSDAVEHFIKTNELYNPQDWWKVPGYIEDIEDITGSGDGWVL